MSWALRELGLRPDADERAVKRAYAARLKTTRPEDDPEGFQRLHEAYQAALAWLRSREVDDEIDTGGDADIDAFAEEAQAAAMTRTLSQAALFELLDSEPSGMPSLDLSADRDAGIETATDTRDDASDATSADRTALDESAHFDLDAFLDDCIALAVRSRDGELLAWLNAQPALWSLAQKAQIVPWLLHRLHEQRPPIQARQFDTLAECFGLFDLHSGYDAYAIQRLRHRLQLTWEVETRQIRALAERTGQDGSSMAANMRQADSILKQLSRPRRWPQALWVALMPGYPSAVRNFLLRLDFGNLDDLPTQIREDQIEFWEAAGDRSRFSKARWAVSVVRLIAYTSVIALLSVLTSIISPPESIYRAMPIMDVVGTSFATMLIAWLAYLAYDTFVRWQALPESAPARVPWLRAAALPVLGMVVVAIDHWLGFPDLGAVMAFIVLLLASQRYRLRSGLAFDGSRTRRILIASAGLAALCFVFVVGSITLGITGVALTLWATDMRKQRAALRN